MRKELYNAYVAAYGVPVCYEKYAVMHGINDPVVRGKEALRPPLTFSEQEVKRYKRHGLAQIDCSVSLDSTFENTLIDIGPLNLINPLKFAWLRCKRDCLSVLVSSGKQDCPKNALRFGENKTVEGLRILAYFKVAPGREVPYDAELVILYGPTNKEATPFRLQP